MIKNKPKMNLFVDVDGVVLDCITVICKLYNKNFCNHKDFIEAIPSKVSCWDFSNQCPLCKNEDSGNSKLIEEWFGSEEFWDIANDIKPTKDSINALKILSSKYNITFCSIGSSKNISYKTLWLNKFFPDYNQVLIKNNNCTMDKSCVNMENSIFIDDNMRNLETSNAKYKFIFGELYDWNRAWTEDIHSKQDGRLHTWSEVIQTLINIE